MKRKPFRPSATLPQNVLPYQARVGLANAEALVQRKQWAEAQHLLQELNRQYPGRVEILIELLNLAYDLEDNHLYLEACLPLTRLRPNDPDFAMGLAGTYLTNGFILLAERAYRQALERWPNHERAETARKMLRRCEEILPKLLGEMHLEGEQCQEIALLHDDARLQMRLGHFAEARRISQKMLELEPDMTVALNIISLAYSAEGRLEETLAVMERVLTIDPENIHALSNTIRFLCMTGQKERARTFGDRLKQSPAKGSEKYLKIAEALHFLGDDAGIVAAYQQAKKVGKNDTSWENPFFFHLVAVAMQRLGKEKEAQQLWAQALEIDPNFALTLENLEDLKKPVEERQGAWPFEMAYWTMKPPSMEVLRQAVRNHKDLTPVFQNMAKQHPEFLKVIPDLLERGNPVGRHLALSIAEAAGTPETLEALYHFALGSWGSDSWRMSAANDVNDAGRIETDTIRMLQKGVWREVLTHTYEIYKGGVDNHSEQVADWYVEGMELIAAGDVDGAEVVLQQALDAEPDSPDILNTMATVYDKQGRDQESTDLILLIHQVYPDYLFSRVNVAHLLLSEGKVTEARELVTPLLKRKRLHYSELPALGSIQVDLLIAEGKMEVAETWLEYWEDATPEDPLLDRAKKRWKLAKLKTATEGQSEHKRKQKAK